LRYDSPLPPPIAAPLPVGERAPIATYVLVVVLVLMFGVEVLMAESRWTDLLDIPVDVLAAAGGSSGTLVVDAGESVRLWTAMFLHADLIHLGMNIWCLYQAGIVLEPLIGRLRYLAVFTLSGFIGSVTSVIVNPPNVVGIGASGGAMGLLAAAYVAALRFPKTSQRDEVMGWSAGLVVLNVLPVRSGIDYAAHAGGAVGGALVVGILIGLSRRLVVAPPVGRDVHGAVLTAGGVVTVLTLLGAISTFSPFPGAGFPIPTPVAETTAPSAFAPSSGVAEWPTTADVPVVDDVPAFDESVGSSMRGSPSEQSITVQSGIAGQARGSMREGEMSSYEMSVLAGVQYDIRGWCDEDCGDLDIQVVESDGTPLGRDDAPDSFPIVRFQAVRSSAAQIRVRMAQCSLAPCTFTIELRQSAP